MSPPLRSDWICEALLRYERPLLSYAARLLGGPQRAGDIVQETFCRLCDQDELSLAPHLAEWLFTVCRNHALDVRRKESRMSLLDEPRELTITEPSPGPADVAEQHDDAQRLLRLLTTLPSNQRETIVLKFQHGFSYEQISRVTGLSVSNVGYLIHTGLKTLRNSESK